MKERLNHLIESQQFSQEILNELFQKGDEIRTNPRLYQGYLEGEILASLFYESSTRTRLSFDIAMLRLGGRVSATENAREFSSAAKGETLDDTLRVIGGYADCIVVRHDEEGALKRAAPLSPVPVINAGDGKGQHPTQALLDLYTIKREFGRTDDLTIAMVGDLANGRTVRSLCYLLGKFDNGIKLIFVSPEHLKMKDDIKDYLTKHSIQFSEEEDLNAVLSEADVIYMTRHQRERMSGEELEKSKKTKGQYAINEGNLHLIRKEARIMHPLPKIDEISLPFQVEKDDPRVAYFRQSENGLWIRMALLCHMLE